MKTCIACGMPMQDAADYPLGDVTRDYCVHCARLDGSMQSFEEKRDSLTAFIIRTQGLEKTAAFSAAEAMMRTLPAWRDRFMYN